MTLIFQRHCIHWRVPSSPKTDEVCRGPSDQCQDYTCEKDKATPSQMNHHAGDLDLLIPIELSQARADMNLNQDLRGNLSVMTPGECHHTEETLPTVPLGQFQVQRSDNTISNSIAHSDIQTPSQSEIKSDYNNSSTITKILYLLRPIHPPKENFLWNRDRYQFQ